ncbi:MAG: hypothetical protein ACRBF0_08640 [Calditrichia bacterium]
MDVRDLIDAVESNYQKYETLLKELSTTAESSQVSNCIADLTEMEEEIVEYRLKKILEEENPYIPEIKRSRGASITPDTRALMSSFLENRRMLVRTLKTLPSMKWDRQGLHAREGHVSFRELIRRLAEKDHGFLSKLGNIPR